MSRSTEETGNIRYDSDFCKIEELIKGNCFSREEVDRLLEILNSRAKQKSSISIGGDIQIVSKTQEIQKTPSQEKGQDNDQTMIDTYHQNTDVPFSVAASPIDIARAYMASRASEGCCDHDNLMSKLERVQPSSEVKQKQILASPAPKPSICWPGAVVHDRHGYATPQSQRRSRLHEFPRTPYSRTTLSKSTAKLQAENEYPYASSPFLQSHASLYHQGRSRDKSVDGYGSVGPIRRIRNKFVSEIRPRGFIFQSSPKGVTMQNATSKDLGRLLPSIKKNMESGETSDVSKHWSGDNVLNSSNSGNSKQSLSSSQAVRKILEHLDRNKPTLKEKQAELTLVTSQRSSEVIGGTINGEIANTIYDGKLASQQTDVPGQSVSEGINKATTTSNFLLSFHDKPTGEAKDVNSNARTSSSGSPGSNSLPDGNAMPSFGFKGSFPAVTDSNETTFSNTINNGQNQKYLRFPTHQPSDEQQMKVVGSSSGTDLSKDNSAKLTLPSISISKPNFRPYLSDSGPGFTFPVSASSVVLSELPTPSITPPSSASFLSMPAAVPSYSFGASKSTPSLVFSFPSSSSAPPAKGDDLDLKFSFGSDNNKVTKLSFSSFGKDGICY